MTYEAQRHASFYLMGYLRVAIKTRAGGRRLCPVFAWPFSLSLPSSDEYLNNFDYLPRLELVSEPSYTFEVHL